MSSILLERLDPALVFARFDLGPYALEMGSAIYHPGRTAGAHIVFQLVVAPILKHCGNRIVGQKNFPEGDPAILPLRDQDLAQERHQHRRENLSRSISHVCGQ
jgi:hypothetical protein